VSYRDYLAFGLGLDRGAGVLGKGGYRYAFNGKKIDDEGEWGSDANGNPNTHYDYGFRIYNPAVARFLSIDPLSREYTFFTPYQFAGNSPVHLIDIDGLEGGVSELPRGYGSVPVAQRAATANWTPVKQSMKIIFQTNVIRSAHNYYSGSTPLSLLTENEKQNEFRRSADNTVAILLYEFATGTGKQTRNGFTEDHPYTVSLKNTTATEEATNAFKEHLASSPPSDDGGAIVFQYYYAFSPDKTIAKTSGRIPWRLSRGLVESALKHASSFVLEKDQHLITRGGMSFTFNYNPGDDYVTVTLDDKYSYASLNARLYSSYRRKEGSTTPFGTTNVSFTFQIPIDLEDSGSEETEDTENSTSGDGHR
jgi:RHS repeat-associated protein